jgi:hypothetical protein
MAYSGYEQTVPQHTVRTHCECTLQNDSNKQCSRKAKFRFIYTTTNTVKYSCGIGLHRYKLTNNYRPFFTQEIDKDGLWCTKYSTQYSWSKPQPQETPKATPKETPKAAPKETPKAAPKATPKATPKEAPRKPTTPPSKDYDFEIKTMERTILHMKHTIASQNDTIQKQTTVINSLKKQQQKTNTTKANSDDNLHKILTDTKQALLTAKSNNSVKQLMFQLHPDKHPAELRWLFEEMFKTVNV